MNGFSSVKEWIQKQLNNRGRADFFILLLLGVLVMIAAIPAGNGKNGSQREETPAVVQEEQTLTEEEYRAQMEKELTELLEAMEGAGSCRVMITLEDDGQTSVDKDVTVDGGKRQESTVVYDSGDGKAPYVIRRERPKVAGVVVVSEGGGNAVVVSNISRAVMALFQMEAHKITVVKMSVQEE